jgi:hypothetical protein
VIGKGPQGLKPALILETLRGAEAPLFHGSPRIRAFSQTTFCKLLFAKLRKPRFPTYSRDNLKEKF